MKIFKVNNKIQIICEWKKTRTTFKHEATLIVDGLEVDTTKICYQNRTWESYEYQSVIRKIADSKALTIKEQKLVREYAGNYKEEDTILKSVSSVMALGEIFADTKKDKNDWKTRILKAGLGEGIIIPDDWDTLDEETKEIRLNKITEELAK